MFKDQIEAQISGKAGTQNNFIATVVLFIFSFENFEVTQTTPKLLHILRPNTMQKGTEHILQQALLYAIQFWSFKQFFFF